MDDQYCQTKDGWDPVPREGYMKENKCNTDMEVMKILLLTSG